MAILFLVSCDPAKILVIKAANKENVSVVVFTSTKIIPQSNSDSSTKLTIQVPPIDVSNTYQKSFDYGIGNWPDKEILDLVANIDSIVINNSFDTMRLTNKEQMGKYLKKHRSGYAGSVLTIEAK
ncbi:MAG: hypothetical protein IPP72_16815 [Chitinophagaceae bacterium]|nr:hypothetical protein [Chitinophagaceae bacterium]